MSSTTAHTAVFRPEPDPPLIAALRDRASTPSRVRRDPLLRWEVALLLRDLFAQDPPPMTFADTLRHFELRTPAEVDDFTAMVSHLASTLARRTRAPGTRRGRDGSVPGWARRDHGRQITTLALIPDATNADLLRWLAQNQAILSPPAPQDVVWVAAAARAGWLDGPDDLTLPEPAAAELVAAWDHLIATLRDAHSTTPPPGWVGAGPVPDRVEKITELQIHRLVGDHKPPPPPDGATVRQRAQLALAALAPGDSDVDDDHVVALLRAAAAASGIVPVEEACELLAAGDPRWVQVAVDAAARP